MAEAESQKKHKRGPGQQRRLATSFEDTQREFSVLGYDAKKKDIWNLVNKCNVLLRTEENKEKLTN